MKIAVFDKWLNTLGGGEKVASVMAESLAKAGHEVHLISNFEVDKQEISEKMGVDLSKVNMTPWFERSYAKLLPKTKEYDIFVNVSFLDHTPSAAKKSVYYVHFPTPIKKNLLGFIKYEKVLPFLRKFLLIPEVFSGLKPIEDVYTRGGKWLGEENTIVFSNTPDSFEITLRIYVEKLTEETMDSVSFDSPNAEVKVEDKYIDHHFNILVFKVSISGAKSEPALKIVIDDDFRFNALGLVSMTVRNMRFFVWNLLKRFLPEYEMALYGSSDYEVAEGLDDYDLFLANSHFTRYWIDRYWDKEATILYPPVDVEEFKPGKKEKIILNVGRFFVGGHSKRQDVLLSAFKQMVDEKQIDNAWELHFVGGVAGGQDHSDYLKDLKEKASGYPVHFHLFASFEELKDLYSRAKIYWHATGYGADEKKEPIKLEHFGITPIEAMAAGDVPLVYDAGGLKEVVDKKSGYRWKSISELKKLTVQIINDDFLRKKKSKSSILRAKKFSRKNFGKQLLEVVGAL